MNLNSEYEKDNQFEVARPGVERQHLRNSDLRLQPRFIDPETWEMIFGMLNAGGDIDSGLYQGAAKPRHSCGRVGMCNFARLVELRVGDGDWGLRNDAAS